MFPSLWHCETLISVLPFLSHCETSISQLVTVAYTMFKSCCRERHTVLKYCCYYCSQNDSANTTMILSCTQCCQEDCCKSSQDNLCIWQYVQQCCLISQCIVETKQALWSQVFSMPAHPCPHRISLLLATVPALYSLLMNGRNALFPAYSMAHGRGTSQDSIIALHMRIHKDQIAHR